MRRSKVSVILSALFVSGLVMLLCSCSDYVGKEKTHPLFVKAGTAKSAGNFQEAAKCYEEFLLICPRSTVTCKELADLYNDALNEPLKAVYYYEKWLYLLPQDAAENTEIRSFAENARKNLYKKLSELYKDDPALRPNSEELKKVNQQLASYVEHTGKLTERNRQLVAIIEKLNEERRQINAARKNSSRYNPPRQQQETVRQQQQQPRQQTRQQNNTSGRKQTLTPSSGKGTIYTVQRGDTLYKISRKFYGSTSKVYLIKQANAGKFGRNDSIRLGQKLVIPPQTGTRR